MDRALVRNVRQSASWLGKSRSKPRAEVVGRSLRFETLEDRRLLTTYPVLLVSNTAGTGGNIQSYDGTAANTYNGNFATVHGTGSAPTGFATGPDGNLYVTTGQTGAVDEFNGDTGTFIKAFVPLNAGFGSNNQGIAFAPDASGNWDLFVSYFSGTQAPTIQEFNVATGASMGNFVSSDPMVNGNLTAPEGLTFGPDGNLYVANNEYVNSKYLGEILCYGGPAGPSPGQLISANCVTVGTTDNVVEVTGGITFCPSFDPNMSGALFVSCYDGSKGWVEEYNSLGVDLGSWVAPDEGGLGKPEGLVFSTQPNNGWTNLFVADSANNRVEYYADENGGYTASHEGDYVGEDANGLAGPTGIGFAQGEPPVLTCR